MSAATMQIIATIMLLSFFVLVGIDFLICIVAIVRAFKKSKNDED